MNRISDWVPSTRNKRKLAYSLPYTMTIRCKERQKVWYKPINQRGSFLKSVLLGERVRDILSTYWLICLRDFLQFLKKNWISYKRFHTNHPVIRTFHVKSFFKDQFIQTLFSMWYRRTISNRYIQSYNFQDLYSTNSWSSLFLQYILTIFLSLSDSSPLYPNNDRDP